MKPLFCLLLLLLAFAPAFADEPSQTSSERKAGPGEHSKSLRHARLCMDFIVFPKVSLSHVSLTEAVDWVQEHNREYTPTAILADFGGINMTIMPRQGIKEVFDVSLRSATLPQVLDAICAQHDYVWCLEPYALIIVPRERHAAGSDKPVPRSAR